jgi:Integrase core domain.
VGLKRTLWSQEAAFRGGHQSLAQELGLNQKAQKANPQRTLHCAAGFEGSQISQRGLDRRFQRLVSNRRRHASGTSDRARFGQSLHSGLLFNDEQTVEATQVEFQKIFRTYGLPLVIRMDNGSPFGSTGALGLTRLSAWWVRLGIQVEFIEPGHPEQNGGHEQMHRIYKAETLPVAAQTLRSHKRVTQRWCWEYNHLRPHEGLAMRVPAGCYRKSRRKKPPF